MNKLYISFICFLRDTLSYKLFLYINKYCNGSVLDVGGRDFFQKIIKKKIKIHTWTNIEPSFDKKLLIKDHRYNLVIGDGCNMPFNDNTFNSILNIQVLEHVYEPMKMVRECARVLKKGGYGIFYIPQTANIHMVPHHYYNFTRFWIEKIMTDCDLEIIELIPMGGGWMTNAYRNFYFLLMIFQPSNSTFEGLKRNFLYYFLLPVSICFAIISVIVSLFFSIGDYYEEPPNHIVVIKKK